jgi:hypothetical protein
MLRVFLGRNPSSRALLLSADVTPKRWHEKPSSVS